MPANGHPSLLGTPSIVKSCSNGDSDIEDSALLPASVASAEGPDHIFTPSDSVVFRRHRPDRKRAAALFAALTFGAASGESLSSIEIVTCLSSLAGDEERLKGGVVAASEPYSFARSLY